MKSIKKLLKRTADKCYDTSSVIMFLPFSAIDFVSRVKPTNFLKAAAVSAVVSSPVYAPLLITGISLDILAEKFND